MTGRLSGRGSAERDGERGDWSVAFAASRVSPDDRQQNRECTRMAEIIAHVRVDSELASYQTFFDHQWAKDIHKLVRNTKLMPVVDSLTLHWKSVADAHLMPWLVTKSLSGFAAGFLKARPPVTVEVVGALQRKLVSELGDAIPRRAQKALKAAVERIAMNTRQAAVKAVEVTRSRYRPADIWAELFALPEFQLSLLGSQRLCYAGVYFGYENFVRQCTSLATGVAETEYQDSFSAMRNGMETAFGHDVTGYVVDKDVNVARHVRNALVHAGGRISDSLREIPHGLVVEGDVLQIVAADTAKLFHQLKARAFALAEQAVTLPAIKATAPVDRA
jgi:hypothetical protein